MIELISQHLLLRQIKSNNMEFDIKNGGNIVRYFGSRSNLHFLGCFLKPTDYNGSIGCAF